MNISTPQAARRNDQRDTSRLWFKSGDTMEAYVRGAVAWPMTLDPDTHRVYGYAVVCCQDVGTKIVYVMSETRFECVDHIVATDGQVLHRGIAPWFNDAWTTYFCDTWYYNCDVHTHAKWARTVHDSTGVNPKPMFSEVLWSNLSDVELAMYERGTQGLLNADPHNGVAQAMANHKAGRTEKPCADVWAMLTAIAGYDRWPWWDPSKQDEYREPVPVRVPRKVRWAGGTPEADAGEGGLI